MSEEQYKEFSFARKAYLLCKKKSLMLEALGMNTITETKKADLEIFMYCMQEILKRLIEIANLLENGELQVYDSQNYPKEFNHLVKPIS